MKSLLPYIFCIILGAVLVLWFRGCSDKACPCDGKVISTKVKSDSVTKTLPADTSSWHHLKPTDSIEGLQGGDIGKAIRTGQYRDEPKSLVHTKLTPAELSDTAQGDEVAGIYSDYLSDYHYNEDYHFSNADVHVETHISANKIDSQRVILSNIKEKIITNTITKEIPLVKHNEIYLGVSAMGNMVNPFYAFGPSLSFKTKSDRVLEAGVLYTRDNSIMYQFGIKTKISLHKN